MCASFTSRTVACPAVKAFGPRFARRTLAANGRRAGVPHRGQLSESSLARARQVGGQPSTRGSECAVHALRLTDVCRYHVGAARRLKLLAEQALRSHPDRTVPCACWGQSTFEMPGTQVSAYPAMKHTGTPAAATSTNLISGASVTEANATMSAASTNGREKYVAKEARPASPSSGPCVATGRGARR
jgi:hypothetical protein